MSQRPRVSVLMPAYHSEDTIAAALDALASQTFSDFETIVVDSSRGEATAQLMADRYPGVHFHHSRERLLPHAARNLGAGLASGELLVFTDPDCVARPDWLERLVAAHDRGHPVVGGAIELAQEGWVTTGIHLTKFCAWSEGGEPGTRADLATANALWSRQVLSEVGPFSTEAWCGDTEVSWRTRAAGIELRFEPGAVVTHTHEVGLRAALRERRARGEDFARMRIAVERWSRARAGAHLLLAPVVPGVMLARSLGYSRRSKRLRRGIWSAPVQVAGYVAWSLGEAREFARALFRR